MSGLRYDYKYEYYRIIKVCVTHRIDELCADDISQVKLEPGKTGFNQYFICIDIFSFSNKSHITRYAVKVLFVMSGSTFQESHPDRCPCQTTQTGSPDQEAGSKSPKS